MNKEFATTDELTANYWSQHLRSPGLRMMGHMGYDFRRGLGRYSQGMTYPFRHDRGPQSEATEWQTRPTRTGLRQRDRCYAGSIRPDMAAQILSTASGR